MEEEEEDRERVAAHSTTMIEAWGDSEVSAHKNNPMGRNSAISTFLPIHSASGDWEPDTNSLEYIIEHIR